MLYVVIFKDTYMVILFIIIMVPRVLGWVLLWAYLDHLTIFVVLLFFMVNWSVSLSVDGMGTGWKLRRSMVCMVDSLASLTTPIFPQTMRRMTVSTFFLWTASFIGLILSLYYEVLMIDPETKHVPVLTCFPNQTVGK